MPIQEGIYFNLPNEDYHNDPALSHSGMTKVLVSWPDYWADSVHNPDREPWKATEAMQFGERSAMLLLQPDVFHERFNTYGNGYNNKATYLSSVQWARINESVAAIRNVKYGDDHFKLGYPEVSIFWRDISTGIMLRARIDYLRTFGGIDMKRIKAINNTEIGRAVKSQGLDIQDFLYREGIKAARQMLRNMGAEARAKLAQREGVDLKWLNAFMDETDLMFRFLFQRSTPPFIWEFRELEPEVLMEGANAVFAAIKRYQKCMALYGTKRPPEGNDTVKTISQYHVPRRDYDYGED